MYVEYYHHSEIFHEALEATSDVDVAVRNIATGPETPLQLTCTVSGPGANAFERAVETDPSVSRYKLLEEDDVRTLLWVRVVSGTIDQRAYEIAVDAGGVYLQSRCVEDGWYTTMNYPDQAMFRTFCTRLEEAGMDIEPTLVRTGEYLLSGGAFDLTPKQEAVVQEAVDVGYFEIPREGSLAGIARRLDISEQAVSERLRRALDELAAAAVTAAPESRSR